jgi:hypothetical protein
MDELVRTMLEKGVQHEDLAELGKAIAQEPAIAPDGSLGQQTSNWIGRMASKALTGTWALGKSIGVGAAGKIGSAYVILWLQVGMLCLCCTG